MQSYFSLPPFTRVYDLSPNIIVVHALLYGYWMDVRDVRDAGNVGPRDKASEPNWFSKPRDIIAPLFL